jgi:hypothetical protein
MKLFGKTISNQAIFTTMATIVSVCALVVSLMQTYYQHKYLHAAAWPHLQATAHRQDSEDSTKSSLVIKLMNKGVGPAIVESVSYTYKGKKINNVEKLIQTVIGKSFSGEYKNFGNGEVMAQNEEFTHIGILGTKNSKIFSDALGFMKMRIVYSSVHDQKWEYIYDPELPNGSVTNKLN